MAAMNKRIRKDVTALLMSSVRVELQEDCINQFFAFIEGPADTPYEGGVFQLHVTLPPEYPYKSPSIGFSTRILHPNVDYRSGSVCLDVLNSRWTPVSDLVNVFTQFLPHLLRYPNPSDPLNGEAAQLLIQQPEQYAAAVADCVRRHAVQQGGAAGAGAAVGCAIATEGEGEGAQAAAELEDAFDFDGVDLATMEGASQASDLSDF